MTNINNKDTLDKISTLVEGLSEENYDKSMVELKNLLSRLSFDSEVMSKLEEIFGYDPEMSRRLRLYLSGTPSELEGIYSYLKHSLGIMEQNKPESSGTTDVTTPDGTNETPKTNIVEEFKTLPNGDKAKIITAVTTKVSPEIGTEMLKLVTGEVVSPEEPNLTKSKQVIDIIEQKDSIDPENFSEDELKIYSDCMDKLSNVKDDENLYPIVDTLIQGEHPYSDQVTRIKSCLENMDVDQASFALAKIGAETRVEVSDALFAEVFADTNEQCKNFSESAVVYGTEIGKAEEIVNSLFSEEGNATNFSEVEQELYNRYTNNFSYMENELNNDAVNFSEEELEFAAQFSENELLDLINYSDEELIDVGVPKETVAVISSIRDKVECPVKACEEAEDDECCGVCDDAEDTNEDTVVDAENFAAKAGAVKKLLKKIVGVDDAKKIKNFIKSYKQIRNTKNIFGGKAFYPSHRQAIRGASQLHPGTKGAIGRMAARGAIGAAAVATPAYGAYKLVNNSKFDAVKKILGKADAVLDYLPQKAAGAFKNPKASSVAKWGVRVAQGLVPAAALGYGEYRLVNNGDVEEAVETFTPEDTAKVVEHLSNKICDADLNKEQASRVLVNVEDQVSPEVAEAVQADVLQNIDARFSVMIDNLELTPEDAQKAEQVIDSSIEEINKEQAGEVFENQFSAYGISSYNKYYANYCFAESVLDAVTELDTPTPEDVKEKVEEKVDEVKAETVAEASPSAEVEEVVKEQEIKKDNALPIEKTDSPTSVIVTKVPANKTDEPTKTVEEKVIDKVVDAKEDVAAISKDDAVSNFSDIGFAKNTNKSYIDVIRKSLGM